MSQFILTENYLRANLPISDNLDIKLVIPFINEVEIILLQDILGTLAFNELKTRWTNKALDDNEKILVTTYIKPFLAWKTLYEALPWIAIQVRNKGVVQQESETNKPADDLAKINLLLRKAEDKSAAFEKRLKDYLLNWSTNFAVEGNIFWLYQRFTTKLITPNYDDPGKTYGPIAYDNDREQSVQYYKKYWGIR
ncbi:hypothetical protein UFOVP182_25 [uncultured Caudovirales phage]|uniref:Uncharacterized protein n=1 Tax=uncultured Caudovirales phage TaxID=2100421 RepID=A0A6J7WGC0_9CAUD|nr:hypothetical protein UFOVP182_25 [uncultured Caudovirales phage]